MKINENKPPPYSVLKPDTSSDSPSLKSKGERFLSAKHATNQQNSKGKLTAQNLTILCPNPQIKNLYKPINQQTPSNIKIILTSYETA